jgi:tRNA threonylcarbamoyladenosine biosynthesis protein TsaE
MTSARTSPEANPSLAATGRGSGPPSLRCWRTRSEEETRRVGEELARELLPAGVLLLSGDLAAGKTVLAQGVARGLGIDTAEVQSPTYTLIREHSGDHGRLVHLDLYRLAPEDAAALGLEEILQAPAVKVIEWAERLPFAVPGSLRLWLERSGAAERDIREVAS